VKLNKNIVPVRAVYSAFVIGMLAALVSAAPLRAETIRLTAVSGYSPVASWVHMFKTYFMPEVDRRLLAAGGKHKIAWTEGFSGTVVKPRGELEAIESGIGDIGIVVTAFHVDKVPLYNVAFVTPFVSHDLLLVVRTIDALTEKYPEMRKSWEKYNQVYLAATGTVDTYQVVTSKPVRSLSDFEGMKIGGAGPNLLWLEGIGATGVNSTLAEWYNGIKNGIYEGCIVWAEAAGNFKLYEVAPNYLNANLGATNSFAVTVNKDIWDDLPKQVQTVLQEVATDYRDESARFVMAGAAKGVKKYLANGGTVFDLPESERAKWAAALPNIAGNWANNMEAQGLSGRAILGDYMRIMRENDQPIARQWDK
jgi:TRAP-type C4-dicarboxylate transport system substrate-binding protein